MSFMQQITLCRILSLYDVVDEDVDNIIDQSQPSAVAESASFQMQLPIIELLKVCICSCGRSLAAYSPQMRIFPTGFCWTVSFYL